MGDDAKKVHINVEASDAWWVFGLIIMVVLVHGDPDLLDVLQEWCRRYIATSPAP